MIPAAPWAWLVTQLPCALAAATAAAIIGPSSSIWPGSVPSVSTAPVAISLIESAPDANMWLTRAVTSAGVDATPSRISGGTTMPSGSPVTSPPPPGTVI